MDLLSPRPRTTGFSRRPLAALALLAAALAATGCSRIPGAVQDPFDYSAPGQIRLFVINHDFNDATLFAFRGAQRIRLGIVTGKGEASYTIPWPSTQALRVQISLLTQNTCTTPELQVDPGEILELQIQIQQMRGGECVGMRGG
jgi:hypothetical protein